MAASPPRLELTPIGVVHSPWREKRSAPRQPSEARGVEGRIELYPSGAIEHALEDLDAWSHIWVLFWFHLNTGWRTKVLPPRSPKKRGVFATRSPYRPNPIGLSVLALERIEGRVLHVRDLDILDQTPVLDIKPYVAYTDALPGANAGWLPAALSGEHDPGLRFEVRVRAEAEHKLAWLAGRLDFDLRALAEAVLSAGPTPHPYRRIRVSPTGSVLAVKDFRLEFELEGTNVIAIKDVRSGYRAGVLADPRARAKPGNTPLEVHREFQRHFSGLT